MDQVELGDDLETLVGELVASGRFTSVDAVIREALRLLEERELKRAEIDAAIRIGLSDCEAGRLKPLDEVFDRVETRLRSSRRARRYTFLDRAIAV